MPAGQPGAILERTLRLDPAEEGFELRVEPRFRGGELPVEALGDAQPVPPGDLGARHFGGVAKGGISRGSRGSGEEGDLDGEAGAGEGAAAPGSVACRIRGEAAENPVQRFLYPLDDAELGGEPESPVEGGVEPRCREGRHGQTSEGRVRTGA